MKLKYKSYREQGIECSKNGNRIEVPCVGCNQTNLICIKYKTYCHSIACRDERLPLDTKRNVMDYQFFGESEQI